MKLLVPVITILLSYSVQAHAIKYVAEGVNPVTKERVMADVEDAEKKGEYKIVLFDRLSRMHIRGVMSGKGIVSCVGTNGVKYRLKLIGTVKE